MERLWDEEKWSFPLTDHFSYHLRYDIFDRILKLYKLILFSGFQFFFFKLIFSIF